MSAWNFDLSAMPKDRKFIAETTKGEVMITVFNSPTKTTPSGWFSMIGSADRIVAWQEIPAPSGGKKSDAEPMVIEGLGAV